MTTERDLHLYRYYLGDPSETRPWYIVLDNKAEPPPMDEAVRCIQKTLDRGHGPGHVPIKSVEYVGPASIATDS